MTDGAVHDREDPGVAAEYALGVLDEGARSAARRRAEADPAFAAEVRTWEDRLHPLVSEVQEAAPPAELWPRVAASVAADGRPARTGAAEPRRAGLWRSLAFWRGSTAGLGALAAAALAVVALRPAADAAPAPMERQPPMLVAKLDAPEGGSTAFLVAYDPMRGTTMVTPLVPAAEQREYQLWIIPADGRPRSLGMVGMAGTRRYELADDVRSLVAAGEGAQFAVSVEPEGGSPTGAPTGPVVAAGTANRA